MRSLSLILSTMIVLCLASSVFADSLVILEGDNQTGALNKPLYKNLKVKLLDNNGNPQANKIVNFSSNTAGTFSNNAPRTDNNGVASVQFFVNGDRISNPGIVARYYINGENRASVAFSNISIKRPSIKKFANYRQGAVYHTAASPKIWTNHIGHTDHAEVPDIIDFSYAGYKNSSEGIPDSSIYSTVYDVTDYGAIPNDGLSDTRAVRDALNAARSGNAIVFFPPGQYDVIFPGEGSSLVVQNNNTIIKGSGARGSAKGGTTIKMYSALAEPDLQPLFTTKWQPEGSTTKIAAAGNRGDKSIQVEDASVLNRYDYIRIRARGLWDDYWKDHCYMHKNRMGKQYKIKKEGISVTEYNEIESISGNTVYLKVPITTPVYPDKYEVYGQRMNTNIGFEDLHIDCNFLENYQHLVQTGHWGIKFWYAAHSWVRRCRISNTITGIWTTDSYACSILSIIVDGNAGHNSITNSGGSSRILMGLIEDNSDTIRHHGTTTAHQTSGMVMWRIGGETIRGPDTHSSQPRLTLMDNYYGQDNHSSTGAIENQPQHLDGYYRWNNYANTSEQIHFWNKGQVENNKYVFTVTEAIMIGYTTEGASRPISSAKLHIESFGNRVSPFSIFEAQLARRTDADSTWVDDAIDDHLEWYSTVYGSPDYAPPTFTDGEFIRVSVYENQPAETLVYTPDVHKIGDATLSYGLDGINDEELSQYFQVGNSSGVISTTKEIDHEANKLPIGLTLTVTDSNSSSSDMVVWVSILNVNEAPVFKYEELSLSVPEDAATGTNIGDKIVARDPEYPDHENSVIYTLGGVDKDVFNFQDNWLRVKDDLDFETKTTYSLILTASDVFELSSSIDITINVTDVEPEDIVPRFDDGSSASRNIEENSAMNSPVGDPISATDNQALTYSKRDLDSKRFNLNPRTGQLYVNTHLDYETKRKYNFTMRAKDPDGNYDDISVTINVMDIANDITPVEFRSRAVRDAIGRQLSNPVFSSITEADLTKVKDLNLYKKSIKSLKTGDFDGLENLISLDISGSRSSTGNEISRLPRNIFSDLSSLETLNLERLLLEGLNGNIFSGTPNLKNLQLDGNKLRTLPEGIFDGLSDLEMLDLANSQIQRLTAGIFGDLTSLEDLILNYNNISSLPAGTFNELTALQRLRIRNNKLTALPADTFSGLRSLTMLELGWNRIASVSKSSFNGIGSLNTLTINDNRITSLPNDVFKGLQELNALQFHNNRLTELPDGLFQGSSNNINLLRMQGNIVDPLPFEVSIVSAGNNKIKALMPIGATFDTTINLSVEFGTLSKNEVVIKKGDTESDTVLVTSTDANNDPSINIRSFSDLPQRFGVYVHTGYKFVKSPDLPYILSDENDDRQHVEAPDRTAMLHNFPNPFNPETWIPYKLHQDSYVKITISDATGVIIRQVSIGVQPAGYYTHKSNAIHWDGKNNFGEPVSSGLYFYTLQLGTESFTGRMMILK